MDNFLFPGKRYLWDILAEDNLGLSLVYTIPTGDISGLSYAGRICPSSDPGISHVLFCVRIQISKMRYAMETACRIQHTVAVSVSRAKLLLFVSHVVLPAALERTRRQGPGTPGNVGPRG